MEMLPDQVRSCQNYFEYVTPKNNSFGACSEKVGQRALCADLSKRDILDAIPQRQNALSGDIRIENLSSSITQQMNQPIRNVPFWINN